MNENHACIPAICVSHNRIYVAGGRSDRILSSVEYLDMDELSWRWVTSHRYMLSPRCFTSGVLLQDQRSFFITGGAIDSPDIDFTIIDKCEIFDTYTNSTSPIASLNRARSHHRAVLYKDRVVVIGGTFQNTFALACEEYDPNDNSWHAFPDIIRPMTGLGAVVADDCIYICGGQSSQGIAFDVVSQFDGAIWKDLDGRLPCAFPFASGFIWNGRATFASINVESAYMYDKTTDTWKECTSLPKYTGDLSITRHLVALSF
jgi:hypothetical protein